MTRSTSIAPEAIRVLLVEDDPLVRLVAAETLGGAGFDVVQAEDASEALAFLGRGNVPDVLVTDVRMPGPIDGIGLATIVATRWPQLGIVICSAHACPTEQDLPAGSAFLAKPYVAAALIGQVTTLGRRSTVAVLA